MLQKKYRLPSYLRLKNSMFIKTDYFNLTISGNKLNINRFGFIAGKTVDKRATARNRAKRLVRSCIEDKLVNIPPGHDMLFILKKGIIRIGKEAISNQVAEILKDKKLLN